jgi:hypothetical protein
MNPPLFQVPGNRAEIVQRPREAVQAGHHEGLTGAHIPQALREHRPLVVGARALFLKDGVTAGLCELGQLHVQVLLDGGYRLSR